MKSKLKKFEENFKQEDKEWISDLIRDHLVPSPMWDPEKFCSMDWTITVNLQKWED